MPKDFWCVYMFRGRQRRRYFRTVIIAALVIHLLCHLQQGFTKQCSYVNDEESYSVVQMESCRNKTDRPVLGCSAKTHKVIYKDDARVLGTGLKQKVFLTIGIATIQRTYKNTTVSYLERTLDSLLNKLSPEDITQVHIVIFLADLRKKARENVKLEIQAKYQMYIDKNVINVIQAPREFYPKLNRLARTLGDSQERMFWRSKQTMDYVYLFNYCEGLSDYYLHIEDDVITVKYLLPTIRRCMDIYKDESWAFIQTSIWGFIGKLFKGEELDYFARMLRLFYKDIPCDWLLQNYPFWRGDYATFADRICGNIFMHIGNQSSSLGT